MTFILKYFFLTKVTLVIKRRSII